MPGVDASDASDASKSGADATNAAQTLSTMHAIDALDASTGTINASKSGADATSAAQPEDASKSEDRPPETGARQKRLGAGPGTARRSAARLKYRPQPSGADVGDPPWAVDLWREVYARDTRPLAPGCR